MGMYLFCCVADDPVLGVGELYEYLRDKREEATRTSNVAREPNNVQRKHMYQYCAVSESHWPFGPNWLAYGSA